MRGMLWGVGAALVSLGLVVALAGSGGRAEPVPHGQDRMPGPPLSPAEALRKMTVPEGFTVELVASEPDIVNPVAMTFDERGRIWITESLEYPRQSPGKGRDRIKVLEDTRGTGTFDKITVFADGLNIPSGLAVGHGGVWVANSPDLLFLQDTDGDGKADKSEVVVTGFGRHDTHELPNSLTWGPDGWLYGLNGVFNEAHVQQAGKDFRFTCALFRVHPRTREFQLFAEGTSNPWGLAWDDEGSAFVSACVIDHLWHLAETGYYLRQGGPYPPFTWPLGSIVRHKHQKAAYCGLHYFDSDTYPPEYRQRLYMGNIHGGCVNVDVLRRDGSTYAATPAPDFLQAHDPWFMPVAQKTGPDGCLYVLDWYDRYHCYQDANRDPAGIDRLRGRLYRVRYKDSPRAAPFDLARESDDQLVRRLHSPNVYFRDTAQRLLCERDTPAVRAKLRQLVLDDQAPRKARMHGLWALISMGPLDPALHRRLLDHPDPGYRAWAVRAAGNVGRVEESLRTRLTALTHDRSPDVQLQVAIAARKVEGLDPLPVLLQVLSSCGDDKLIPAIVWQNLHPLLESQSGSLVRLLEKGDGPASPNLARMLPRILDRLLAVPSADADKILHLLRFALDDRGAGEGPARQCLTTLATKTQNGEVSAPRVEALRRSLRPVLAPILSGKTSQPLFLDAALLAVTYQDESARPAVRQAFASPAEPESLRSRALDALIFVKDAEVLDATGAVLADPRTNSLAFRGQVLAALGRLDDARVAPVVLAHYAHMEADLQPRAIELLTQRPSWGRQLLLEVARQKIPASVLNVNHLRKLLGTRDPELARQIRERWGTVRQDRNPEREQVVARMRRFLTETPGDPVAGLAVFKNVCAQCHKIHGEGQDVGPDLTANGRSSFDQLLSNVFDPSLVIGDAYRANTVTTTRGRSLTGLVVEDNPQRVVLKLQGGKLETIPRDQIDELTVSKVSLMPEGLEKQLQPQEIADLFAFLTLDRPPGDPRARKIPGSPVQK